MSVLLFRIVSDFTIHVDESGNATLNKPEHIKKYPFFVLGFVFCKNPELLQKGMARLLVKLHKRKKYHRNIAELKFNPYRALEKQGCSRNEIRTVWEPHFDFIRKQVNSLIVNAADGVFAGVLDKRTIKRPTWSSEQIGNFLFNRSLYDNILPNIGDFNNLTVVYDKGRLDSKRTQNFNQYMTDTESYRAFTGSKKYSGTMDRFQDVDSYSDSGIWAADFIAGSFRHAYLYDDHAYVNILKPKFIGNGVRGLWF